MKFFYFNYFRYQNTSLLGMFLSRLGMVFRFLPLFLAIFATKCSLFLSFFFIRPTIRVKTFSVYAILTIFKALYAPLAPLLAFFARTQVTSLAHF